MTLNSHSKRAFPALLNLPRRSVFLAPLAGVSDHPFRRVCQRLGADLTYVEMLSAVAINHRSRRTLEMMVRHEQEKILGVQVTGRSPEEIEPAVAFLHEGPYETIDLNMGCPVAKVVKAGCGSALIRDPDLVFRVVSAARRATSKPLSVKIRLGWDHSHVTGVEVARACEAAGADWLTVHGRFRSDGYGDPVNLQLMAQVRAATSLPMVGNGNLFEQSDALHMTRAVGIDAVMISRGALGNPWIFRELKGDNSPVTVDEWLSVVLRHITDHEEMYAGSRSAAITLRKHLLWYTKGWPGGKHARLAINALESFAAARQVLEEFASSLIQRGITTRLENSLEGAEEGGLPGQKRFIWDPKYEMDRALDRGVGDDSLTAPL